MNDAQLLERYGMTKAELLAKSEQEARLGNKLVAYCLYNAAHGNIPKGKEMTKIKMALLSAILHLFFHFGDWLAIPLLANTGKKAGYPAFFLSFALDKPMKACYNGIGAEKSGWRRRF